MSRSELPCPKQSAQNQSGSDVLHRPRGWRAPADGSGGRHADGLLSGGHRCFAKDTVDLLFVEDRPAPRRHGHRSLWEPHLLAVVFKSIPNFLRALSGFFFFFYTIK